MTLPDALKLHSEICEMLHQIILNENRSLKGTGNPPDEPALEAKRAALAELSDSLATIRAQALSRTVTPEVRASAAKAQQTILKTLLVDRENEKLLLEAISAPRPPKALSRPPAAHFQRAYSNAS
jgi:hypothetical protein